MREISNTILIVCISILVVSAGCCDRSRAKMSTRAILADTPEMAFKEFWQGGLEGNEDLVNQVSSYPPNDWLGDCVGSSDSNRLAEPIRFSSTIGLDSQGAKSTDGNVQPLRVSFSGENITENLRSLAIDIFASRIAWERVRIDGKRILGDEARLDITIATHHGNMESGRTFGVALKRTGTEWKVIGAVETGVLAFVDENFRYAEQRPACQAK